MSKSYTQIQQQIQALQREAEKLKQAEVAGVITKIKGAIKVYALTAEDLGLVATNFGRRSSSKAVATKGRTSTKKQGAAKFRDEAGNTWGGRGPRPQWLREAIASGKSLEDFAV